MNSEALDIHVEDLRELAESNQEIAEVVLDMMAEAEAEFGDSLTIE